MALGDWALSGDPGGRGSAEPLCRPVILGKYRTVCDGKSTIRITGRKKGNHITRASAGICEKRVFSPRFQRRNLISTMHAEDRNGRTKGTASMGLASWQTLIRARGFRPNPRRLAGRRGGVSASHLTTGALSIWGRSRWSVEIAGTHKRPISRPRPLFTPRDGFHIHWDVRGQFGLSAAAWRRKKLGLPPTSKVAGKETPTFKMPLVGWASPKFMAGLREKKTFGRPMEPARFRGRSTAWRRGRYVDFGT